MAVPRSFFISTIERHLTLCQTTSRESFEADLPNRVFDKFPDFIPLAQREKWKSDFQKILEQKTFEPEPIIALETEIIKTGYPELFDGRRQLQPKLVSLLQWEGRALNSSDIFCAYIGAANAQIIKLLNSKEVDPVKFTAVCSYINKNYAKWAAEEFKKHDNSFAPSAIFQIIKEKPAVAMGVGAMLMVAACVIARGFFSASQTTAVPGSDMMPPSPGLG